MNKLAQKHILAGEFAEAEALYRQALETEAENPEVLYLLSVALKQQGKYEDALDCLEKAYAISPDERFVLHGLGNAYLQKNDFEKALEYFQREIRIDPNFPQGHAAIAYTQLRQENWQQAEQAARTALRASEEHQPTMVILAAALLEQGKASKAINYFQRVVELDPENGIAMEGLAQAFMNNGQSAFAAQCCHNALKIHPGQANILQLLGQAEEAQLQWKAAAEAYAMALEIAPQKLDSLSGLARVLGRLGRYQQAETMYMRLLRQQPHSHKERLELSRLFIKQGKYRKVGALLSPLFTLPEDHQDRIQGHIIMAGGCLKQGQLEMAMKALEHALSVTPVDPQARLLHAEILQKQNQPETAVAQLLPLVTQKKAPVQARLMAAKLWLHNADEAQLNLAMEQLEILDQQGEMTAAQALEHNKLKVRLHHNLGEYTTAMQVARQTRRATASIASLSKELEATGFEMPTTEAIASFAEEAITDRQSDPIFVFAWPATGRQKLLAALQAHAAISVVNEAAGSQQPRSEVLLKQMDSDALLALSETDIRLLRKRFWRILKQALPDWEELGQVVDASWLPVEALPMIYRLFPAARIISVERNIDDLELSWKLYGYQDTELMRVQYSRQLQLLQQLAERIPLHLTRINWEQIEADPEAVLTGLFTNLGVSWEQSVLAAFMQADAPMMFPAGDWQHYQQGQQ